MAAFVKSVERISIDFPTGTDLTIATVALTKGQNAAKCSAFGNSRFNSSGTMFMADGMFSYRVFDDAGTPTLEVGAFKTSSITSTVEATVIEWGSGVTVQQGGPVFMVDDVINETINAVNQDNAFVIFSYRSNRLSTRAEFDRYFVRAQFLNDTTIQFSRASDATPEPDIYYTVIESNGVDFQTEYVTEAVNSSDEMGNVALSNAVDLDHAFLIPSFEIDSTSGTNLRQVGFSSELTGPNNIFWTRMHNGSPSGDATYSWWVVRSDAAGIQSTQQVVVDTNSTTDGITDQTINSVDLDRAAIITGKHIAQGEWPAVNTNTSTSVRQYKTSLEFIAADEVRTRNIRAAAATVGRDFYFSVVEFNLEALQPGIIEISSSLDASAVLDPTLNRGVGVETSLSAFAALFAEASKTSIFAAQLDAGAVLFGDLGEYTSVIARLDASAALSADLDVKAAAILLAAALQADATLDSDVNYVRRLNAALQALATINAESGEISSLKTILFGSAEIDADLVLGAPIIDLLVALEAEALLSSDSNVIRGLLSALVGRATFSAQMQPRRTFTDKEGSGIAVNDKEGAEVSFKDKTGVFTPFKDKT